MTMTGWNIYLDGAWMGLVYCSKDCDAEYVRRSLIDHDGYDPNIEVRRAQ